MTRIVLSLFLVAAFVPFYLLGSLLVVAWIRRRAPGWLRRAKLFILRQIRPLTALRFRITALTQILAVMILGIGLRHRLEIIELALLLLAYVVVISALTFSLLSQMPAFKRITSDAFMRPILLVTPFIFAYITRGYSAMWVDETLTFSSENAPMTHFAGTVMMTGFGAAILVMTVAVAFEFAMIVTPSLPTGNAKRRQLKASEPKASLRAWIHSLFSATLDLRSPEHREWRRSARSMRLIVVFGLSFAGCLLVAQAALSPFRSGFGRVLLSAIAFDFDAAPAGRCTLTKDEMAEANAKEPALKALMLSTSQEKALLVRRSPHLFDPVELRKFGEEKSSRTLIIGRVVTCFDPSASSPAH